jgi:drug/metabolite transporter (DMT)-like permease
MISTTTSRLLILATATLFSTGGAAIKSCGLNGWQVASFRSGIAAVTLLVLLPRARRRWNARTLLVAASYAATMILFVLSNKLTTAANAIFLQSAAPLYVLLLSPWLGEPVRRRDLGFMAAIALGTALFFLGVDRPLHTAPDPALGNLLAVLSGVFWSLTILGLRWIGREGSPGGPSTSAAVVAGNVLAFGGCLPWALPLGASAPADWLIAIYLGTIQIGLAYACLTAAIGQVPALQASLLLQLEPVLNPVWAFLVHRETPGGWALAGGAIILLSTAGMTWLDARRADH